MTERGMIEEMTRDYKLCGPCDFCNGYIDNEGKPSEDWGCLEIHDPTKCGICVDTAKLLINAGYRKLPKGAVVLLQSEIDEFRKETAKEILALIDGCHKPIKEALVNDGLYNAGRVVEIICSKIKNMIAETYSVGVEE